jgi:hypothetical protein
MELRKTAKIRDFDPKEKAAYLKRPFREINILIDNESVIQPPIWLHPFHFQIA